MTITITSSLNLNFLFGFDKNFKSLSSILFKGSRQDIKYFKV